MSVIAFALVSVTFAQTYDTTSWDCELLKSAPANVSTREAIQLATKKVMPERPGDATTRDARVTVVIVVDRSGSVQCVHAKQGHPLLISGCIQAAKDWTFKPYRAKGHPVPFVTDLTFRFTNQKISVE